MNPIHGRNPFLRTEVSDRQQRHEANLIGPIMAAPLRGPMKQRCQKKCYELSAGLCEERASFPLTRDVTIPIALMPAARRNARCMPKT